MFKLRKNREKEKAAKGSSFGSKLKASTESLNDLIYRLTPPIRRNPPSSSSSPCASPSPVRPSNSTTHTTTTTSPVFPSSPPPSTPPSSSSFSPPPLTPYSGSSISMASRPFSYTGGSGISQLRNSETPLYHPRQVPSTSISVGNSEQSKEIPSISLNSSTSGSQTRNTEERRTPPSPSSVGGSGFRLPPFPGNKGSYTSSPSGSRISSSSPSKKEFYSPTGSRITASPPSPSAFPLLSPRRDSFSSTNTNTSTGLTTETTFSSDDADETYEEVEEYEEEYFEETGEIEGEEEEEDGTGRISSSSSKTCSIIEEQQKKKAMMIVVAEELQEARFLELCSRLTKKNIRAIIRLQACVRRRLAQKRQVKLIKNRRLRDSIAQELVQTERVYVKNLTFINECFVKPLNPLHAPKEGNGGTRGRSSSSGSGTLGSSSAPPPSTLLKEKDYRIIFSPTLEIILNYNQELLSQLELKLLKWNPYQTIGDIFIKMTQYLKVYTNYVKGYMEGLHGLERVLQHNCHFANFVREVFRQELNREEGEKLESSLSSLLVTPIQRLPRYVLLLDQMDLATDSEHPDKPLIAKALASMRLVASHVNDQQRELERAEKLLRMQASVSGIPETILTAHRRFLREGFLTRVKLKASSNTSSISSGSSSIKSHHTSSFGSSHHHQQPGAGSISASQSCIKKKLYYCFLLNDTLIFTKPPVAKRPRRDSVTLNPGMLDLNGSLSSRRQSLSRTVSAALTANARQDLTAANNSHQAPAYAYNTMNKTMKFKYIRKYSLANVEVTNLSDVGFLGNHTFEVKIQGHGLLLLSAENEDDFNNWMKDLTTVAQDMKKKSVHEAAVVAAAVVSSKRKSLRGWLTNSSNPGPLGSSKKNAHTTSAALVAKTLTDFGVGMSGEGLESIAEQAATRNASSKRLLSRQGRTTTRKRLADIFPEMAAMSASASSGSQTAEAR